jgi:hypothetical protein
MASASSPLPSRPGLEGHRDPETEGAPGPRPSGEGNGSGPIGAGEVDEVRGRLELVEQPQEQAQRSEEPARVMAMDVRLVDVTTDDMPLFERWLHADHVRRYWGEPEENTRLLRELPTGTWRALIEADGRKVGLVLWQHPTRKELDEAGLHDVPEIVIDIDIMIGEAAETGRGVGPSWTAVLL